MTKKNIYKEQSKLYKKIQAAIHRWRRDIAVKGIAIVLSIFASGLAIIAAFSAYWTQAPYLIPAVACITGGAFLFAVVKYIILPFRKDVSPGKIARLLETKHPELEDRLVTALDSSIRRGNIEIFWLRKIIEQASAHTQNISLEKAVTRKQTPVWTALSVAAAILLALVLFSKAKWQPNIRTMVNANFQPPKPLPELYVTPGDSRVRRGGSLQIAATLKNYLPNKVVLYFSGQDSIWRSVQMQPQGNEHADMGHDFFDVRDDIKYYVRAGEEISEIYSVTVYEAPQIKRLDLTFNYPAYTKLQSRRVEDSGDVWAPTGTGVTITALSSVPVVKAEFIIGEQQPRVMKLTTDSTANTRFTVDQDSFYKIRLTSGDGLDNSPLVEYFIRALKNQPPAITVLKPKRDIKATMLEEIPLAANISDDFGMQSASLVVQVNSDPEIEIPLQEKPGEQIRNELSYQTHEFSTLLYLEDLDLQPGDFASYYFKAKESGSRPVTSDMYYIEIANFENIYTVATSSGGQSANGENAPQFAKLQKDIITAANKLIKNKPAMPEEEYQLNLQSIAETQTSVRASIESIVQRAKLRGRMLQQQQNQIVAALADAVSAMKIAEPKIEADSLVAAMPAMRSAYQHLLKADVLVHERQISNSRSRGQGGAQNQRELTRLFQDELDKMKNKYETLQQADNRNAQQEKDEALRKVQELARRQNQLNLANQQLAQKNLSEEEKRREIKKLQRQQEQLNKDTQNMLQQMAQNQNQQDARQSAQANNELRKASQAMNRATQKLQQQQPQNALASGQQALDKLRKLEQQLQDSRNDAKRQAMQKLQNQMNSLAQKQKDLAKKTGEMSQNARRDSIRLRANLAGQEQLRDEFQKLLKKIEQLSQRSTQKSDDSERELQTVERDLKNENIESRMRQAEASLASKKLDAAEKIQKSLHDDLASAGAGLQKVVDKLKNSQNTNLRHALNETQKLRKQLEDLITRQGKSGQKPANNADLDQKIQEGLWQSKPELKKLRDLLSGMPEMQSRLRDLENITNGIVRQALPGSQRLDLIEARLIQKMKLIEAEIQAQLALETGVEAMQNFETAKIPQEYRELVEQYFRRLSTAKNQ